MASPKATTKPVGASLLAIAGCLRASPSRASSLLHYFCTAGLLLTTTPATAYELQVLQVSHSGKSYHVQVQARLAQPPERVFAVLTEFANASQLNPSIKSMVIRREGESLHSLSHTEGCFVGICRDLVHAQKLTVQRAAHGGGISAVTEPIANSSFESGENQMVVQADGQGSVFRLASTSVLSIWLPPLIGPYAVQKRLREEALVTLKNLERIAGE